MSKKVGIMALYYKTYNYGAQLQVYALQKAISKLGYNAEVIRFRWYMTWLEQFYRYACTSNIDKFEAFSKAIPHSIHVYAPENIHECIMDYDIFICGSDQIWGVSYSMPKYVLPQITLSFVPNDKVKIAYGISMGGAAVPDNIKTAVSKPVQELDCVSVREKSAIPFVSSMTEKSVADVFDPTLLLDIADWDEIVIPPDRQDDYIFVYNIGMNELLENASKEFSEKLRCNIVCASYSPNDLSGPPEFIGLIKEAKYVLTNSYHGTVFAILYKKDFYAFAADNIDNELSKNIRITDLLETLGLQDRFVKSVEDYGEYERSIDYSAAYYNLQVKRKESIEYLDTALKTNKKKQYTKPDKSDDTLNAIRDYISAISEGMSGKELSYNKELAEKDFEIEFLNRELYTERTRNAIYCKLMKYQSFGLSLDYDPLLDGKVIIYGAGMLGQMASMCFNSNLLCFVDANSNGTKYRNYIVYKLGDNDLNMLIRQHEKITFLVTPIIDYDTIEAELKNMYPSCGIISIDKVLEKIRL